MALQKGYVFTKEKGLRLSGNLSIPGKIPEGFLLLEVKGASICGTDIQIMKMDDWTKENVFPFMNGKGIVLGHEFYGEVVKKGDGTTSELGTIGAVESHYPSPQCMKSGVSGHDCPDYGIIGIWGYRTPEGRAQALGGGFSQYALVPQSSFYPVGDLHNEFPCSLIEPSGNTWAIMEDLEKRGHPDRMLIFGSGPHGINLQVFAEYFSVKEIVVVEPDDYRRGFARGLGSATLVLKPEDLSRQITGKGFDYVLDMAGAKQALDLVVEKDLVKDGGIVGLFGLPKEKERMIETAAGPVNMSKFIFEKMELIAQTKSGRQFKYVGYTGRTHHALESLITALRISHKLRDRLKRPLRIVGPLDELGGMLKGGFPDIWMKEDLKIGFTSFRG